MLIEQRNKGTLHRLVGQPAPVRNVPKCSVARTDRVKHRACLRHVREFGLENAGSVRTQPAVLVLKLRLYELRRCCKRFGRLPPNAVASGGFRFKQNGYAPWRRGFASRSRAPPIPRLAKASKTTPDMSMPVRGSAFTVVVAAGVAAAASAGVLTVAALAGVAAAATAGAALETVTPPTTGSTTGALGEPPVAVGKGVQS